MLACVLERSNFSLAIRDCLLKIVCFRFKIYRMNADRERAHPLSCNHSLQISYTLCKMKFQLFTFIFFDDIFRD